MEDYYIFNIPVYRCSKDKYYADMDEGIAKRLNELVTISGMPIEKDPQFYKGVEYRFRQNYGGPWEFNQIVGWLCLYVKASHIGGHLWWVNKRIQRNMRNKQFYLTTDSNVLSTYFTTEDNSKKIFNDTLIDIQRLAKEESLKRRFVDLETFRNVGPFINWRKLLNNK